MTGAAAGSAAGSGAAAANERSLPKDVLAKVAAAECVLCGSMMIDLVREPFVVLPEEQGEFESWKI